MPQVRKVNVGSPLGGVRWNVRVGATAKVVLDAVSAGPEDTFTVVFDGDRAVGRVMLIDGEWDWFLRGVASGREPTRPKALRALAAAYGARKIVGR